MEKSLKRYKYMLILVPASQFGGCCRNEILILDHPYTEKDLTSKLEELNQPSECDWIIGNIIPLEVTGHFDYMFLVKVMESNSETIYSFSMLFDHQITSRTLHDDYEEFKRLFKENKQNPQFIEILHHQEIP